MVALDDFPEGGFLDDLERPVSEPSKISEIITIYIS
jgi:hypothetical protein